MELHELLENCSYPPLGDSHWKKITLALRHRRRHSLGANNKVAQNEKNDKKLFHFQKYVKSWSVLQGDIKMSINLYFVLTKWYFFPEQIEPLFWKNYISQYSCTSFCILEHGTTVFVLSRSNSNKRQFMSLSVYKKFFTQPVDYITICRYVCTM